MVSVRLDMALMMQRSQEGRHTVVAQSTGMDARRHKVVSQRIHLDDRRHLGGVAIVKGIDASGHRRTGHRFDGHHAGLGPPGAAIPTDLAAPATLCNRRN